MRKVLCIQILLAFQLKKFVSKTLSSPNTKFIYELYWCFADRASQYNLSN